MSKKSLLITVLGALAVFIVIAISPIHERFITVVGADSGAVVVMRCVVFAGVTNVNSSDPAVTLPAEGTGCGVALQGLYAQGFKRQDALSSGPGPATDILWVLVRNRHDND